MLWRPSRWERPAAAAGEPEQRIHAARRTRAPARRFAVGSTDSISSSTAAGIDPVAHRGPLRPLPGAAWPPAMAGAASSDISAGVSSGVHGGGAAAAIEEEEAAPPSRLRPPLQSAGEDVVHIWLELGRAGGLQFSAPPPSEPAAATSARTRPSRRSRPRWRRCGRIWRGKRRSSSSFLRATPAKRPRPRRPSWSRPRRSASARRLWRRRGRRRRGRRPRRVGHARRGGDGGEQGGVLVSPWPHRRASTPPRLTTRRSNNASRAWSPPPTCRSGPIRSSGDGRGIHNVYRYAASPRIIRRSVWCVPSLPFRDPSIIRSWWW